MAAITAASVVASASAYGAHRSAEKKVRPPDPAPAPRVQHKDKCPCCGSWEFVAHAQRVVCMYCRVPKGGEEVRASSEYLNEYIRGFESSMARLHVLYGSSALRPEMAVRIGSTFDDVA